MVLRPDAVHERLQKLEEVISNLLAIGSSRSRLPREDFRDTWAAERGLQLGAEIILDIGNHILTAHFGVSPVDYEDIITRLGATGVVAPELRERLKGLGGFRNILVHGYLRVDPDRVNEYPIRAPADFTDFAVAVRDWLGRTRLE